MSSRLRGLLCWLLCALMLSAGAPAQPARHCGNDTEPMSSCREQQSCCCPDEAESEATRGERNCDCKAPEREPAPTPAPDGPKLTNPLCAPEPARAPPRLPQVREPAVVIAAAPCPFAHGPLPYRTRQVAYSVWRL